MRYVSCMNPRLPPLLLLVVSLSLQAAPFWVWPVKDGNPVPTVTLEHSFYLDGRPLTAQLRAIGDFASIEVHLNGNWIANAVIWMG